MAIIYILILGAVLLLLNTYPLIVSQNMVFQSKQNGLQSSISMMISSMSDLDELTEKNVEQALSAMEKPAELRLMVTNAEGRVLYDNREGGGCEGDYALYTEIVWALQGSDAFHSEYKNQAFRSCAAAPVVYRGRIIGAVYAYEYETEQAALLSGLQQKLMSISIVTGILVLLMSLALSRMLSVRFGKLLTAIRVVREGDYNHRADVGGRDEIAELAMEFNQLTDRLQVTENARRRFVADASHELKTPLASIRLLSDSILQTDSIDEETTREFVGDIRSEAERLQRITEELLKLTRLDGQPPIQTDAVSVRDAAERVVKMLRMLAQEKRITLQTEISEDCLVRATDDDFHQILYNLAENAIKYNREGGFVRISLQRQEERAVILVEDNGIGIPKEDLSRIFERFYRVDKARSRAAGGTGLGLSIVQDTARRYGGDVEAIQRPEGGTVFAVTFPLWYKEGEP